jgi:hypothetical protein
MGQLFLMTCIIMMTLNDTEQFMSVRTLVLLADTIFVFVPVWTFELLLEDKTNNKPLMKYECIHTAAKNTFWLMKKIPLSLS